MNKYLRQNLISNIANIYDSGYFPKETTSIAVPSLDEYRYITVISSPNPLRVCASTTIPVSLLKNGVSCEATFVDGIYIFATYANNTTINISCATWGGRIILHN